MTDSIVPNVVIASIAGLFTAALGYQYMFSKQLASLLGSVNHVDLTLSSNSSEALLEASLNDFTAISGRVRVPESEQLISINGDRCALIVETSTSVRESLLSKVVKYVDISTSVRDTHWNLSDRVFVEKSSFGMYDSVPIVGSLIDGGHRLEQNTRSNIVIAAAQALSGYIETGVLFRQRVLPVGLYSTIVGRIVYRDGLAYIGPSPDFGILLCPNGLTAAIGNLRTEISWLKFSAFLFGAVTLDQFRRMLKKRKGDRSWKQFMAYIIYHAIGVRIESWESSTNERSFINPPRSFNLADDEIDPRDTTGSSNTCVVCLERDTQALCSPCGHACLCLTCAYRVSIAPVGGKQCPMCRSQIEGIQQFFVH